MLGKLVAVFACAMLLLWAAGVVPLASLWLVVLAWVCARFEEWVTHGSFHGISPRRYPSWAEEANEMARRRWEEQQRERERGP